jgi:predicted nuclease of predicted toxin-antitoxin system
MKLLPDENLPVKLKDFFSNEYEIKTVSDQDWVGKKNGELLGLMTLNGFDGLVTIDKNLVYQQNISKFDIKIFVLNIVDNKISTLKPFIKKLESYSGTTKEKNIVQLKIGESNS